MHVETLNLREVMIFLVAAGVVVPLVRRLNVSPVFGFLVVGLVIGPHGLARFADALPWLSYAVITDLSGVRTLAELGVVFLLFMIGLELSVDRLWAMRRRVFGLGGAQVVDDRRRGLRPDVGAHEPGLDLVDRLGAQRPGEQAAQRAAESLTGSGKAAANGADGRSEQSHQELSESSRSRSRAL